MSEPLAQWVRERLAYTEAAKARVRMVDMPAVALPLNGTLHIHPRAPVVRRLPSLKCAHCGGGFWRTSHTKIYCGDECREAVKAARAKERRGREPKRPVNVRQQRNMAVKAVCAIWPNVTDGDIASQRRSWFAVRPRQAAYQLVALMCPRPEFSRSDIGRAFGRDHATILDGLRKHVKHMATPAYAERFEAARALIRSAIP